MRLRIVLAPAFVILGSLSCSNGTSRFLAPEVPPSADVRITLDASPAIGQAGQPVTIIARVENRGPASIVLHSRCPEPAIRIYDWNSIELFQRDPTQPVPCPLALDAPMLPGDEIEVRITFDGGYYWHDGQHHQAPTGDYLAIASFVYSLYQDYATVGEPQALRREVRFTWQ